LRTVFGSPPVWDTVNTKRSHPARKDEAGLPRLRECSLDLPMARSPARRGRLRQRESDLCFPQAPITLWESDRPPAIDLPVANAMNEKRQNVQWIAAAF
jgi:hypothetical protein